MREKHLCRRRAFEGRSEHHSFVITGAVPHYAPDLLFRLEHVLIDVEVDPRAKTLRGKTTQKVSAVAANQTWLRLDQVSLRILSAKIGSKKAGFRIEGNAVLLDLESGLGRSPKPGEKFEFTIEYETLSPRRGIYFTGPDDFYPNKPCQAWTQGQDEDCKYWFPSFDYPNQKATSEVIATVPKGFTAISNGALVSKKESGQSTRFHYRLGTPHVTYLIALAVGEFSEWSDAGPHGIPVQYFVEPGREEDGKRAFGHTPKMIEAFEAKIGVPYPYEKYSQVAVQDFIFGGMENTSATTQTDLTLHDARAHLDFSSDPLVSHELAHQWFGDLLTCRDWSHGWLNEGFATFMERIWIEQDPSPAGGWEEAKYYAFQDLKEYLEEDRCRYRRPIVCNTYVEPMDLFDTHLYQKGGLVLNLLRKILGEGPFWEAIQLYVTSHRGQNVETLDLIRSIEDATGRNLRRVFDEWVFGAGYPEFELSYEWRDEKKLAEIVVEQKQRPEGQTNGVFHVPATIELTFSDGKKISETVELNERRERLFLFAPSKPTMVRFDPDHWIPKTLKFPRPKEMLLFQLANDPDCMGRIEAAYELVRLADAEVLAALGKAALHDAFWGAQAEAAQALSEIRTDRARDELIRALQTKNPKARRAIVQALGNFKDEKSATAVKKLADKDESYPVEASATYSWARAMLKPAWETSAREIEVVEKFLLEQLEKPSYREVIRGAALRGLSELPGIDRGERPRAMEALVRSTRRGQPGDVRYAAISALGSVAKTAIPAERMRVFRLFSDLADESDIRLRQSIVQAIRHAGDPESIPILSKIQQLEIDGRVLREIHVSINGLRSLGGVPEAVGSLKATIEKLEEDHRKLKSAIEELKAAKSVS